MFSSVKFLVMLLKNFLRLESPVEDSVSTSPPPHVDWKLCQYAAINWRKISLARLSFLFCNKAKTTQVSWTLKRSEHKKCQHFEKQNSAEEKSPAGLSIELRSFNRLSEVLIEAQVRPRVSAYCRPGHGRRLATTTAVMFLPDWICSAYPISQRLEFFLLADRRPRSAH